MHSTSTSKNNMLNPQHLIDIAINDFAVKIEGFLCVVVHLIPVFALAFYR